MVMQPLSRRKFLGATAASAGLMLASGPEVFGQNKPPSANGKLNIALIGFGAEGRVLVESLLKIESIQLVAIVDIWPYAREYGEKYLKQTAGLTVRSYE